MTEAELTLPIPGAKYRHFKGNTYFVICNAQIESSNSVRYSTIYVSLDTYQIYSRDASTFMERVDFLSNPEYISMIEGSQWRFLLTGHPSWLMTHVLKWITKPLVRKLLGAVDYESR